MCESSKWKCVNVLRVPRRASLPYLTRNGVRKISQDLIEAQYHPAALRPRGHACGNRLPDEVPTPALPGF